ncbi:murein DD-endopeptidase MepM/ murein hydrolase activator NlpD [Oikeobacillus pervagus]|uniref:Murein DD-endopeptidase MepM/ murein hydrolase activator NlpD n=1 Tax=Oikeobacillus pervagus TaxID=1325931 RepID=A0AAJ1WGK0_9BACI|nr:M23 family metallopeptidase [Oikeobacillus pervagus]MDQ0215162.1 murein DD-endopeptidase MepM/ murein hydrolase activator NlpD [Oikeobacillus pervagus]
MKKISFLILLTVLILFPLSDSIQANEPLTDEQRNQIRKELFQKMQAATNIPWYYFAAIDQYERNLRFVRKDLPKPQMEISIHFSEEKWAGILNPNKQDTNPMTIAFFNGFGSDGNGDGKADRTNNEDILAAMANHILKFGTEDEHIRMALWNYYRRDKAVGIIIGNTKIYKQYQTLNLNEKSFPLPLQHDYSYKNTWGDARGWGGRRIHEGTDIFADYGVPVRSTCYGIIEMKGWNRYGGWRIGIRDINNTYHYFAHLSGFAKDLKVGQVVEPGMLIGGVGSTGYGPPGTSGKFPPHLHFGMYKDNGSTEWSFDPFPHLKQWERQEKLKNRNK